LGCSFVTACSGAQSTLSPGPLPQSVGRAEVATRVPTPKQGKSFTRLLNPAGGKTYAESFGGFQSTLAYASNNAANGVTMTLTNSGSTNLFNAPTPAGSSPVLFLEAQVSGTQPVTFQSASLAATITSQQFAPATSYSLYAYEGGTLVGSALALPLSRTRFAYQTLLQGLSIAPGTPLVLELVPTADANPGTLFVANTNIRAVTVYAPPFSGPSQGLTATITNGVGYPFAVLLDSAGNLYVATFSAVTIYSPPFTSNSAPSLTLTAGLDGPQSLGMDTSGNLFVLNVFSTSVTKYEPPYVGQNQGLVATISNGLSVGVNSVYVGPSNNLYVGTYEPQTYSGIVDIFNPPFNDHSTATSSISYNLENPSGIIVDPSNNVYIADQASNFVNIYTPPFTGPTQGLSQTITNGIVEPGQMAFDSAGNLYVPNVQAGVNIYAPPYNGTPQTITNGVETPFGVAVQPGSSCDLKTKASSC
jgi:hypothetical protein